MTGGRCNIDWNQVQIDAAIGGLSAVGGHYVSQSILNTFAAKPQTPIVLWRGKTAIPTANQVAHIVGGQTIGGTPGGAVLGRITDYLDQNSMGWMYPYLLKPIWTRGSAVFVNSAESDIFAVLESGEPNPVSIFETTEFPIVLTKPNPYFQTVLDQ